MWKQIHTMKCYSTIKRNEVLIPAATWMSLEDTLSKKSQTQKATHFIIAFL